MHCIRGDVERRLERPGVLDKKMHCIRGDVKLDEQELRAHLANVLRLENISVFLGAGASVAAGGKTVQALWKNFLNLKESCGSARRFAEGGFLTKEETNAKNGQKVPNIEVLLDQLEIAKLDWQRRKPTSRKLKTFVSDIDQLLRCVVKAAILNPEAWTKAPKIEQFPSHVKLLQRLVGARQPGQASPWIFTTNYDLAIEWAAESVGIHTHTGFVGIHNRIFSPQSFDIGYRNVKAHGEARFGCNDVYLAKLHGSLTWVADGQNYRELAAPEAWYRIDKILEGDATVDDSLMVFPRAAKYVQTVGFLAGELFRRFSDFLAQQQSCIIIAGYSFGDDHINRLIRSALLNPTLQIVVFLPEFVGTKEEQLNDLKPEVRQLIAMNSPRITFVGGGDKVYFDQMVNLLPEPMLYDLKEQEFRQKIMEASESKNGK